MGCRVVLQTSAPSGCVDRDAGVRFTRPAAGKRNGLLLSVRGGSMTLFPDCPIAVDVVPLTAKTIPVYLRNTVLVMLRVPAPPTVKR